MSDLKFSTKINTAILAGREFAVDGATAIEAPEGITKTEAHMNGDGSARIIQSFEPQIMDGLILTVNFTQNDDEFLRQVSNKGKRFNLTLIYVGGLQISYQVIFSDIPKIDRGEGTCKPSFTVLAINKI